MSESIGRSCDSCTACCDGWVSMNIGGCEVYPGKPCPNSTGTGCKDYANRPDDPCRQFHCAWVTNGSPLPEWMKPNQAGVLVLLGKHQWRGIPVDVALPVGAKIPEPSLNWMQAFVRDHGRLLIYTEPIQSPNGFMKQQQTFAYGPPAFQAEMLANQRNGNLW
ncbi:MAG TPA: hypothetical protein VL550_03620 [Rhodocyclaceae bacterium]|nr:hypothetical protein [Rhodocyclaceae bacterium]